MNFSGFKKSKLSCIVLNSLLIASLADAKELDYLSLPSQSGSNANFLFVLDYSTSLQLPYKNDVSLSDPVKDTVSADARRQINYKNAFDSLLLNKSIIKPSLDYTYDEWYCPDGSDGEFSEGVYYQCKVPYKGQWFLRRLDVLRDQVRDLLPLLKGAQVAVARTSDNLQGFKAWEQEGFPNKNVRQAYPDANNKNSGSIVIESFKTVSDDAVAVAMADRLNASYHYIEDDFSQQSPLVESLYEAYKYYTGAASDWPKTKAAGWDAEELKYIDTAAYKNGVITNEFISPMTECSTNHVVVVTDGQPTFDWNANAQISQLVNAVPVMPVISNKNYGAVTDFLPEHTLLDEFVGYIAHTDLMPGLPGKQTIQTHFISTWPEDESADMLKAAAAASSGMNIELTDIDQFYTAMQDLILTLKSGSGLSQGVNATKTNAAGLPLLNDDQAFIHLWSFENGRWVGNLKKYNLNDKGSLIGINKQPLYMSDGSLNPDAQSAWSQSVDGDAVLSGGAAEHLSKPETGRFTLMPNQLVTGTSLAQDAFLIRSQNKALTAAAVGAASDQQREPLLQWAAGMDVQDLDADLDLKEARTSLGDSLNTDPLVIYYDKSGSRSSVVLSVTNEGYLHAFNTATGKHLYSFMPHEMLQQTGPLMQSGLNKTYGLDGQPVALYDSLSESHKHMVYLPSGRGGSFLYALDVTAPDKPVYAWSINNKTAGFELLGNTISKPQLSIITDLQGNKRNVIMFGGGIDTQAAENKSELHTGQALYILDALTGELITSIAAKGAEVVLSALKNPIVTSPVALDSNKDGVINMLYFNDIRGQIFKCDFDHPEKNRLLSCALITQVQKDSEKLYFYSELDAAFIKDVNSGTPAVALSLVSGNRFEPLEKQDQNRMSVFFDLNATQALNNSVYVKTGPVLFENYKPIEGSNINTLQPGSYFNFATAGEKSFSKTLFYENTLLLSTYIPSGQTTAAVNGCGSSEAGSSHLYGFSINGKHALMQTEHDANDPLLWSGSTVQPSIVPDIITTLDSNVREVGVGVLNTDVNIVSDPLIRNYWLQH